MASPSSIEATLQRWAHPRVLVLTSPEVDRLVGKNLLSLTDLLKPLGATLENVPTVYFRSVTRNYPLKHFGVKFVSPIELEAAAALAGPIEGAASNSPQAALNSASIDGYLDTVLRASEPSKDRYTDGVAEVQDVPGFLRTTPDPTPWYSRYRTEFHEALRYHESELIDQPLAVLVAVATNDANPIALIESLRALRNLPAVFQKGIYDSPSNMLRSIVVLHDKHSELTDSDAKERAARVFQAVKKQYGTEVLRLLELNSLAPTQPNLKQKDMWKNDCERAKWQTKQAMKGKKMNDEPSSSVVSSAGLLSSTPPPIASISASSPPASYLNPGSMTNHMSVSPHSPAPSYSLQGHPTINTSLGDSLTEPQTPKTPSTMMSIPSATSQFATNALAEMGMEETATVEQEQAELKARASLAAQHAHTPSLMTAAVASTLTSSSSSASAASSSSSPFVFTSLPALYDVDPASIRQARGQYLSPGDIVQLQAFIGDFVLKSLLPHLERKVAILNEKVSAVRKGLKNSLKAFFGSGRGNSSSQGDGKQKKTAFNPKLGTYDWSTVESQARQLADLAFIIQDYELAQSTYRVCAGDYKQDKITRHFACSQEMLGLSIVLGDTSGIINQNTLKELITIFESSISAFISIGDIRRCTRVSWFYSDCLRWMGGLSRISECTNILLRSSEKEQSIRTALSMEQAAYLYLYHIPTPLIRKYSFHLVMSGHLYHKYHQKIFGVRSYSACTSIYEQRAWFSINDHLNYYLGKEYFHLQSYQESVQHFIRLIGETQSVNGIKPKQTQEKQLVFLKEFCFVVKKWQELEAQAQMNAVQSGSGKSLNTTSKSSLITGLAIPTVLDDTIRVSTSDAQTIPHVYTSGTWSSAMRVNPLMTLDKTLCNKSLYNPGWNIYKESDRGGFVGERITVSFTVNNPLLIELVCNNLRLKCKWKSKPAEGSGEEEVESREGVVDGVPATAIPPSAVFTYSTLALTLQPLQSCIITLSVTPLHPGLLFIEGLSWDIQDVLRGFHPFALPMRQVTFPVVGGRRRKPEMQVDPSLVVPIMPIAPLLQVSILPSGFPKQLRHGEVRRVVMRLKNEGRIGLQKIYVRMSHPGFMTIAASVKDETGSLQQQPQEQCYQHVWNEGYILLPLVLQPHESLDLPLYIRGTIEGKHSIGLLMKYEAVTPANATTTTTASLKHRLLYLNYPLLVTPLFSARVFTRPSFQVLKDSLLGVELLDKQQTLAGLAGTLEYAELKSTQPQQQGEAPMIDIVFQQVSVLSKMWTIAPMQGDVRNDQEHHSNSLTAPPRKLHSSTSTPEIVSGHHHATASSSLSSSSNHHSSSSSIASSLPHSYLLPPSHILRPFESLTQFFRVTNLPNAFSSASSERAAVHPSASANTISVKEALKAQAVQHHMSHNNVGVHHSYVPLVAGASSSAAASSTYHLDPSHPAISHLLYMEKALLIEEEKQTLIVNPSAILPDVGASNRLDLICTWRSHDGLHTGYHHSPGLSCMKPQLNACSLKVLLSFPREYQHDFSTQGPLDLQISVAIRNTLEDASVSFSFETLPPEEEFDSLKRTFRLIGSPCLRNKYLWSGNTKSKITDLPPGEQVEITLFATFLQPGVFNLNRFRFTVEQKEKKPRVFFFPLQHLIHVSQQQMEQRQQQLGGVVTAMGESTQSNNSRSIANNAIETTQLGSSQAPPVEVVVGDSANADSDSGGGAANSLLQLGIGDGGQEEASSDALPSDDAAREESTSLRSDAPHQEEEPAAASAFDDQLQDQADDSNIDPASTSIATHDNLVTQDNGEEDMMPPIMHQQSHAAPLIEEDEEE